MHPLPLTCMLSVLMAATVTAQNQLEPESENEGALGIMYVMVDHDDQHRSRSISTYSVTHSDIQYIGTGRETTNTESFTGTVVYGKLIYIINDWGEYNTVYNTDTDVYTRISPNITPRGGHPAVFLINSRLYVVGGTYKYRFRNEGDELASMESLSLHTLYNQDWRLETAELPQPTSFFDGCALGDTAIVAGGCIGSTTSCTTNHTYTWQPGQPSWSCGKDMHEARNLHCMVCAEGDAWVIGGFDDLDNILSSMERYSIDRDEWEVMASMPQQRAYQECVYDGAGRIIVTGGMDNNWDVQNDIFIYNMAQNTWSKSQTTLNNTMYANAAAFIPG